MNASNYAAVIRANLQKAFEMAPTALAERLDAPCREGEVIFSAFGCDCRLAPEGIRLMGRTDQGPRGVIISLLARRASAEACIDEP